MTEFKVHFRTELDDEAPLGECAGHHCTPIFKAVKTLKANHKDRRRQ
jgi:hypothetical protein